MTTNYRRGYDFENKIVNHFRGLGFFAVRTAGSHSPIDVIAWDSESVYLIQAKTGRLGPTELEATKETLRGVPFPMLFRGGTFPALADNPPAVHEPYREVWVKSGVRGEDWTRHDA